MEFGYSIQSLPRSQCMTSTLPSKAPLRCMVEILVRDVFYLRSLCEQSRHCSHLRRIERLAVVDLRSKA